LEDIHLEEEEEEEKEEKEDRDERIMLKWFLKIWVLVM
jgi:hypothetical protein